MEAQISINGSDYNKNFLLTSREGQSILREAKDSPLRPACKCTSPSPAMYISRRGGHWFLSRMPGSANEHTKDCRSHIVEFSCSDVGDDLPANEILQKLLETLASTPPEKKYWAALRDAVIQAASSIQVDGSALSKHLLVPEPFDLNSNERLTAEYDRFFATQSLDKDKQVRYWAFGLLKESVERQYSFQTSIKHMPSTKFWVHKDVARTFPTEVPDSAFVACLFSCRKVKSGIEVDEAATVVVGSDLSPVAQYAPPSDAQIVAARSALGLPQDLPAESVFGVLVRNCLAGGNSK